MARPKSEAVNKPPALIGGSDLRLMDENHCNYLINTRQKLKTKPITRKQKDDYIPHLLTWPNLFEVLMFLGW